MKVLSGIVGFVGVLLLLVNSTLAVDKNFAQHLQDISVTIQMAQNDKL